MENARSSGRIKKAGQGRKRKNKPSNQPSTLPFQRSFQEKKTGREMTPDLISERTTLHYYGAKIAGPGIKMEKGSGGKGPTHSRAPGKSRTILKKKRKRRTFPGKGRQGKRLGR